MICSQDFDALRFFLLYTMVFCMVPSLPFSPGVIIRFLSRPFIPLNPDLEKVPFGAPGLEQFLASQHYEAMVSQSTIYSINSINKRTFNSCNLT